MAVRGNPGGLELLQQPGVGGPAANQLWQGLQVPGGAWIKI